MAPPDEEKIAVHISPSVNMTRPRAMMPTYATARPSYQAPVPTHMGQSIAVTILCCMPFGIAAIVYAAQVNSKLKAGDYSGAVESSTKAKQWGSAAFWTGLVIGLLQFIAAISES